MAGIETLAEKSNLERLIKEPITSFTVKEGSKVNM